MTITITLPPRDVKPNARPCWQARARAVKRYRDECQQLASIALRRGKPPRWQTATVQATFYHRTRRGVADPDNALASLKAAFDGLALAGVFATDHNLTHLPVIQTVDPNDPRVELEIVV